MRSMSPNQPISPRQGTGHIPGDWAAKTEEDFVRKPVYRRDGFHHFIIVAACVASVAIGLLAIMQGRRQRDREADLAGQRRCLATFAGSDEFVAFIRLSDATLLQRLTALAAKPESAAALLPDVAAWEKSHGLPSWTSQLSTQLSAADASRDGFFRAERAISELLARRGVVFDLDRRTEARRWFVKSLQPFATAFIARQPDNGFSALRGNPALQDLLLTAYGADRGAGASVADVERLFYLASRLNVTAPTPPRTDSVADSVP